MKKLMIAMAIACATAFAQAAATSWGGGVYNQDGTDCAEGQIVYLILSDTVYTGLASRFDGTTTDVGGKVVDSYTLTDSDAHSTWDFTKTFARTDAEGGVNGYYQMLLLNEAGDKFAVLDAGHLTGITDVTSTGNIKVLMDWNDPSTYLGGNGYTGTVGNIPEPTSGLLLLLGVAGLALRRRRA